MKRKRGQLIGEPFVWILALVVAAFILFFGAKYIMKLSDVASEAQIADFIQDFNKESEKIYYSDVESFKLIPVNLPNKIKRICFYSRQGQINKNLISDTDLKLIQLSKDKNMFFIPLNAYNINLMLTIPNIKANEFLCFENNKKIKIIAKGEYVEVAKAYN